MSDHLKHVSGRGEVEGEGGSGSARQARFFLIGSVDYFICIRLKEPVLYVVASMDGALKVPEGDIFYFVGKSANKTSGYRNGISLKAEDCTLR